MSAWVKVKFYSDKNKKIRTVVLSCPEATANCKEIKIPKNAKSVVVCFTNSYEKCENCTEE